MPTVRPGRSGRGQVVRSGVRNESDIMKTTQPGLARDDLSEAFAGDENNGPSGSKSDHSHSTHFKSRKSKHSKDKEPIR